MKAAWKDIANEISKPDDASRQNWRSILDSKRYYRRRRKTLNKSGSGCELEIISDESEDPWEFSEDLEFMADTFDLRTTSSSQVLCSSGSHFSQEMFFDDVNSQHTASSEQEKPTYSYKNTTVSAKNMYLKEMRACVSKVADVMTTLVEIARNQKETSVNTSFLNYIDSLLEYLKL